MLQRERKCATCNIHVQHVACCATCCVLQRERMCATCNICSMLRAACCNVNESVRHATYICSMLRAACCNVNESMQHSAYNIQQHTQQAGQTNARMFTVECRLNGQQGPQCTRIRWSAVGVPPECRINRVTLSHAPQQRAAHALLRPMSAVPAAARDMRLPPTHSHARARTHTRTHTRARAHTGVLASRLGVR